MQLVVEGRDGTRTTFYKPLPHQARFHASHKRYCLMEGGRGSGKSKAIRYDAYMRCLSIPRFRALIVRRSMPELKQSHLNDVPFEAEKLGLGREAWHATDFVLRFPNGSTLRFGHVEDDNSLARYLSSEFEAIYFDELATFTLRQFLFLTSSLRSPIPGLKCLARGGTNPVGPGASWVKRWFIDKNPSYEEAPSYDPNEIETIHSTMDDNPHIDRVAYDQILNALPSDALRKALRHGEWVVEGQMFSEWRETDPEGRPWHVVDDPPRIKGVPIWEVPHIEIVRALDWGYSATGTPGLCTWFACLPDDTAIGFREYVFKETLPGEAAAEIKRLSEGLRVRYTVADTAMFAEHEGPSLAEMFARQGVSLIEADKQRVPGWVELHNWLRTTVHDGLRPRPRLRYWREGCPLAIRSLPQMVVDPRNPHDMVTVGVEDEAADTARYFVMSRPSRSREPVADPATAWIRKEIAKKRARRRRDL